MGVEENTPLFRVGKDKSLQRTEMFKEEGSDEFDRDSYSGGYTQTGKDKAIKNGYVKTAEMNTEQRNEENNKIKRPETVNENDSDSIGNNNNNINVNSISSREKLMNEREEMGKELRENNEKICEYICSLRQQRDELIFIIEKQYEERKKLETEMERITYKLCLINKSMAQRIKTKNLYDKTIQEIESNYSKLIHDSDAILTLIKSQYENLEGMINKKTSTDETLFTSQDESASREGQRKKECKCSNKAIKEVRERKYKGKTEKSSRNGGKNGDEDSD